MLKHTSRDVMPCCRANRSSQLPRAARARSSGAITCRLPLQQDQEEETRSNNKQVSRGPAPGGRGEVKTQASERSPRGGEVKAPASQERPRSRRRRKRRGRTTSKSAEAPHQEEEARSKHQRSAR